MVTLRSAVLGHDNDYGPHPLTPLAWMHPLSVCCVVPYFETGPLGVVAVQTAARSLLDYQAQFPSRPEVEVVVVDDGSTERPFPVAEAVDGLISVHRLARNLGRSAARNQGLQRAASASFDMVVFVDSDVVVAVDQIAQIVRLWSLRQRPGGPDPVVVANLFTTLVEPCHLDALPAIAERAAVEVDWRFECRYQPSWIGCDSDWLYVGKRFRLVDQTRQFRDWSGMVGPWSLPNMVLGGCFSVPTAAAVEAGGFDESFATYGFTETTLIARLVAAGVPVVPQLASAAVHVEWNPTHHSQPARNERFRAAHRRFFTGFLGGAR